MNMTNTQKLISQELSSQGVTLKKLVSYQRKTGKTWGEVAERLETTTGIPVSRESLRKWFG